MGKPSLNERWVAVIPQTGGAFRFACMAVTSRFDFAARPEIADAGEVRGKASGKTCWREAIPQAAGAARSRHAWTRRVSDGPACRRIPGASPAHSSRWRRDGR